MVVGRSTNYVGGDNPPHSFAEHSPILETPDTAPITIATVKKQGSLELAPQRSDEMEAGKMRALDDPKGSTALPAAVGGSSSTQSPPENVFWAKQS